MDLQLPAMANLEANIVGPARVSPGQTWDYVITVQNNGVAVAENVTVIDSLPEQINYISSSDEGLHKWETNELIWKFKTIPPKTNKIISLKSAIFMGIAQRDRIIKPDITGNNE